MLQCHSRAVPEQFQCISRAVPEQFQCRLGDNLELEAIPLKCFPIKKKSALAPVPFQSISSAIPEQFQCNRPKPLVWLGLAHGDGAWRRALNGPLAAIRGKARPGSHFPPLFGASYSSHSLHFSDHFLQEHGTENSQRRHGALEIGNDRESIDRNGVGNRRRPSHPRHCCHSMVLDGSPPNATSPLAARLISWLTFNTRAGYGKFPRIHHQFIKWISAGKNL